MNAGKWFCVVILASSATLLAAPFTAISSPDAAYLGSTIYIDISSIPNSTTLH